MKSYFVTIANSSYTPNFSLEEVLYPEIKPFEEGRLNVSELHTLWYAQYGNPNGIPVVVLHGGPGFGCGPNDSRYFDPKIYRIILFDQRGSKRSIPIGELKDNTTQHLIDDIEQLRKKLEIDKWLLFGGSWGSAYALLYGEYHPESCLGFILRGVFLATKSECNQLWYGMRDIFPEVWEEFVTYLPTSERENLIESYHQRLNDPNPAICLSAAHAFMKYDLTCAFLKVDHQFLEKTLEAKENILGVSRVFMHYCTNHFFIKDNEILEHIHKIQHLPIIVVQGRYDIICRPEQAYKLHKVCPNSELIFVPESGHSAMEIGTTKALVSAGKKMSGIISYT